jgi:hypothetical protein
MKKLLFTLLAFLSISVAVNKVSAQSGAKIEFAKETHDYGKIKNGADPYCSFEFKNTGDAPLIISDAKGSCGCTVPEWPKEPIAPGAKAIIKVRYDTKREGVISKNVTIMSNAVNAPEKVIYITGEVIGAPAPDPVEPAKN